MLLTCQCAQCGEKIQRYSIRFKKSRQQFCDWNCYQAYRSKNKTRRTATKCAHCEKRLPKHPPAKSKLSQNRYCNRQCWIAAKQKTHIVACAHCGQPLAIEEWKIKKQPRFFCGQKCYRQKTKQEFIEAHPEGKKPSEKIDYGPNWYKQRQAAVRRDNKRCRRCGVVRSANGRDLDVHHIVPFREFRYIRGLNNNDQVANALDNLITLCRECHQICEGDLSLQWLPIRDRRVSVKESTPSLRLPLLSHQPI
jgi:hypothetical protein